MTHDNEELLKELREKFAEMKKELGFKSSFEDIDELSFIRDMALQARFVSPSLSRQICHRICDTYMSWGGYLHSLIMPNPGDLVQLSESKAFSEEEKKEIADLIKDIMSLVGLLHNLCLQKTFLPKIAELPGDFF